MDHSLTIQVVSVHYHMSNSIYLQLLKKKSNYVPQKVDSWRKNQKPATHIILIKTRIFYSIIGLSRICWLLLTLALAGPLSAEIYICAAGFAEAAFSSPESRQLFFLKQKI